MNPESSPSDRQAGRALVFIYLFLILFFSLLQIVGAYCRDTKLDKARKTESTVFDYIARGEVAAYDIFNIAQLFTLPYEAKNANLRPGIPLRLTPGTNRISVRAACSKPIRGSRKTSV